MDVSVAERWQELKFAELQAKLDEQSQSIVDSQSQGTESRKSLTDQTKQFKKLSDDEKLKNVRSLLKSYQSEIDTLRKRSKFAETCFMDLYKSLALLPDPTPLLSKLDNAPIAEDYSLLARQLERQIKQTALLDRQLKELRSREQSQERDSGSVNSNKIADLEAELDRERVENSNLQNVVRENNILMRKQQAEIADLNVKLNDRLDDLKPNPKSESVINSKANPGQQAGSSSTTGNLQDESENAKLRRQTQELESRTLDLEAEVSNLRRERDQQKQLLKKLEDDLQKGEVASQVTGWTGFSKATKMGKETSPPEILTSQRDRYKQRAQETEEKLYELEARSKTMTRELNDVRAERERLFTQIRALQSQLPNSASAPVAQTQTGGGSVYAPAAQNLLKELDLDRRVEGLNKIDAALLTFGAQQVVSPGTRRAAAGYAVLVHLILCGAILF